MILYYVPASPYARIARIGLREAGLTGRVEERLAILRKPENPVLDHDPLGRVPTLVESDVAIADSTRVYARLAELAGVPAMRPVAGDPETLSLEALALGLVESLVTQTRELRRDKSLQSDIVFALERGRTDRTLGRLDAVARAGRLPALPAFAAAVLGTAIGFFDVNDLLPEWEKRWPGVAGWYAETKQRGSMIETALVRAW